MWPRRRSIAATPALETTSTTRPVTDRSSRRRSAPEGSSPFRAVTQAESLVLTAAFPQTRRWIRPGGGLLLRSASTERDIRIRLMIRGQFNCLASRAPMPRRRTPTRSVAASVPKDAASSAAETVAGRSARSGGPAGSCSLPRHSNNSEESADPLPSDGTPSSGKRGFRRSRHPTQRARFVTKRGAQPDDACRSRRSGKAVEDLMLPGELSRVKEPYRFRHCEQLTAGRRPGARAVKSLLWTTSPHSFPQPPALDAESPAGARLSGDATERAAASSEARPDSGGMRWQKIDAKGRWAQRR